MRATKLATFLLTCLTLPLLYTSSNKATGSSIDYNVIIIEHKEKLLNDPSNCFHLEQVASSYQAINNFDQAIIYFELALNNCPDNISNKFQLGVCYYLIMDKEKGVKLMDEAIQDSQDKDTELYDMLQQEKKAWLNHWESVPELDWNTQKKGRTN